MAAVWLVVLAVVAALYALGSRRHGYWRVRRVLHDTPLPFLGNNAPVYLFRRTVTQLADDLYHKYSSAKVIGFYRASRPELIIKDPAIIKRVLTTDFACFHPRGLNPNKQVIEPLLRNLFFADGNLWRLLRQRMTPAFTSGKLRAMFPLVVARAERLQTRLAHSLGHPQDARDLMARYTIDFIGACGFGLDVDALNDDDSAFRKLGDNIFKIGPREAVLIVLKEVFPETFKNFKYLPKLEAEIREMLHTILKQRNYEPVGRHDFIDLLLECKKKGIMTGESMERVRSDGTADVVAVEFDEDLMVAQVFAFFVGGFDTSSTVTSYALHQLAYHPDEQARVQQEIDQALAKHNNQLCYDAQT
ncbi:hypothetical protein O3G_MSEX009533 [Manduca sexta]|uniref:unspecific monooxygenase n=1 Tax=Manduca sexta TaxID=7130 RepID=A0A921ZFF1_MANSE|nr:hypothetical protein O3G_MSEX009533 [Manduca sexta]KAG6456054.1 hypothetical protein O3G_MSEX009533 [Manduca sexta]